MPVRVQPKARDGITRLWTHISKRITKYGKLCSVSRDI